ncbi:hypothetical protein T190_06685 [Sinorhizobium meliloti CCBAU 01290]|nr:hypothetical protein T190_06685 [Sinorhizobium meliloti CCBAU 01290]
MAHKHTVWTVCQVTFFRAMFVAPRQIILDLTRFGIYI